MKIEGKVATIIYRNDANGWTVLLLKVGSDYVTATGETESIEVEDQLELEGEYTKHKVYGEQFKFSTCIKVMPKTSSALIDYIATNIKGVGKKTAERIIKEFGDDTINVIRYNSKQLESIKGLNAEKINALSDFFNEEWDKWNVIEFLSKFHISVLRASKIYKTLGEDTISIVKENPYSLLMLTSGLDFSMVDEIAKAQGIALEDESRLDAGVLYALTKTTEFGHTCIEASELIKNSAKLLEVETEEIENTLIRLALKEKIFADEIEGKKYIFRKSFYMAEKNIASFIVSQSYKLASNKTYKKEIEKISKDDNITLSDEQILAIKEALNSKISIITGGPGTGKTTIIKGIIEILENLNKDYVLCAPTGRAAKRITETTNKEAKTLHRLLEITKINDGDYDYFIDTEVKQIEADYVIVDEASMIDIMMMNTLVKALEGSNSSLILVGDVNQLPSVGPGNILKDIIDSNVVNTFSLKQIYRQSKESDIILNAHKVNSGKYLEFKKLDTDCYFIQTKSAEDTKTEIQSLVSYRLSNFEGIDISSEIQVLTPMRKTELGTIELNRILQEIKNPKGSEKAEKKFGDRIFRTGDKVMQIVNDYDKTSTVDGIGIDGVYNGDIGYITDIDNANETLYVKFDDKVVEYEFDELDELEHAYAITIHKSQGSEFDYVMLPLYIGYPKLFTRNLLYTAITRAKKMLIIVGSRKVINFMVDNLDEKVRKTGLKKRILDLI